MRIVALVSGTGSNLQAVIDAVEAGDLPLEIAAVGADRTGTYGLQRSAEAGLKTFEVPFSAYSSRSEWDAALQREVASYEPDLVLSSGFMRIVSGEFIARFGGAYLNTHPALLPAFPGAHGVRDALAYGVRVTGCTIHWADAGVDTGPIIDQTPIRIEPEDTEESLHEKIKIAERVLLVDTLRDLARKKAAGERIGPA